MMVDLLTRRDAATVAHTTPAVIQAWRTRRFIRAARPGRAGRIPTLRFSFEEVIRGGAIAAIQATFGPDQFRPRVVGTLVHRHVTDRVINEERRRIEAGRPAVARTFLSPSQRQTIQATLVDNEGKVFRLYRQILDGEGRLGPLTGDIITRTNLAAPKHWHPMLFCGYVELGELIRRGLARLAGLRGPEPQLGGEQ